MDNSTLNDTSLNDSALVYLFQYVIKKELLSIEKLYHLRFLSKSFRNTIDHECFEIRKLSKSHDDFKNKLYYDKDIYDKDTYNREVIKNIIKPLINDYIKIKLPVINYCVIDTDYIKSIFSIESSLKIPFIDYDDIPFEYKLFIHEYLLSPSTSIELYMPKFINSYINYSHVYKNILIIPLCYFKHRKVHYKDVQYVNNLCFISILDDELVKGFPNVNDRYTVLTVPLNSEDDIDDNEKNQNDIIKYINKIINSVNTTNTNEKMNNYYYYSDISNNCYSFIKSIDLLIK